MTLLIRGPVESEIAVLSFRRSQASCVVPAAGGQERRPEPGSGQPGLRWASLALIFQEGQSQEPALPEVGRFEVFAYDGGRAGPGGVNEEGRLEAEGEGRAAWLGPCAVPERQAAPGCRAKSCGICLVALQSGGSGGQAPPRVLAVSSSRSPRSFLPCSVPGRPVRVGGTGWMPRRALCS